MGIKLKTEEGAEFSFDTVAEFMEFKKQIDAEEDAKETESAVEEDASADEEEIPENESEVKVGDEVRIVSNDDGTDSPYHHHDVGSVGKVVSTQQFGRIEVEVDGETQYLLPHHYEKVEPLGKDANGEDLYKGDFVTGTNDNDYYFTDSTEVMEVLGAGKSALFKETNIDVRIVGSSNSYGVDSTKFIKLSDNLDEAKEKFEVINGEGVKSKSATVGDSVELVKPIKVGPFEVKGTVGMRATVVEDDGEDYRPLEISMEKSFSDEFVEITKDSTVYVEYEDVKVVEEENVVEDEQKFKIGDKVEVVGNSAGHDVAEGEVRVVYGVDYAEPKYNLSTKPKGSWAHSEDIKLAEEDISI